MARADPYIYRPTCMLVSSKLKKLHACLVRALDSLEDDRLNDSFLLDVWSTPPESPAGEDRAPKEEPAGRLGIWTAV